MRTVLSFVFWVWGCQVFGQSQEMEQLKLDLEKLAQFKLIVNQMKQGYQALQKGYNAVTEAAKGNYALHKKYLDGLLVVSPMVKHSPALQQIASDNVNSVKLFQSSMQLYQLSGLFSAAELADLRNRYEIVNQKVADDLDVLELVTGSGKLRMSDAERWQAMDDIQKDISGQLAAVKTMVNEYAGTMTLRKQVKRDNEALRVLSGLK